MFFSLYFISIDANLVSFWWTILPVLFCIVEYILKHLDFQLFSLLLHFSSSNLSFLITEVICSLSHLDFIAGLSFIPKMCLVCQDCGIFFNMYSFHKCFAPKWFANKLHDKHKLSHLTHLKLSAIRKMSQLQEMSGMQSDNIPPAFFDPLTFLFLCTILL